MSTLSEQLTAWRTSNQGGTGHSGLMSQLTIDGSLYDIQDPALDALAETIESRLSAVESKNIRESALAKANNAAKFATEVTQGTNGQITVTYSDAQTTDVKRAATSAVAGQTEVLYTAEDEEVIAGTKQVGDIKTAAIDPQIALSGTTTEAALIEIAKVIAAEQIARANGITTLIGSSSDSSTANTINAAKKYADEAVANLAGTDWEQNAKKVQEIITEIENAENANAWATAIDKLAGLGVKTAAVYYTQAECDEYNVNIPGFVTTSDTNPNTGENYTEEEANEHNAALEGARKTTDVKTPAVYNTVKDYVDAAVIAGGFDVTALDATVRGNLDANDDLTTDHKVGVKIIEQDGVLTSVTVVEDDIASAADLATLESTVETHSEVTAAALVDLNTRLTNLNTSVGDIDLTVKANKAAITTATINNWSTNYSNGNLEWTNTQTTVYVPVTGQSL